MNTLYRSIGISKQAFHQHLMRERLAEGERRNLLPLIYEIRSDHPTMGSREMYYKIMPEGLGRDAFELLCKQENLTLSRTKNWRRTTDSTGVIRFDNLLKGLEICRVDQVWQSDITYFELNGRFCYLTFIIDAFTRRIVGHSASRRLRTQDTTLPALRMALNIRKGKDLSKLIIHSDGGGQYYDSDFLKLTRDYGLQNSMCEYPWENGKAERINGTIKNNYLRFKSIRSFEELVKAVDRTVHLYNNDKPHIGLKRMTPIKFENKLYLESQPLLN